MSCKIYYFLLRNNSTSCYKACKIVCLNNLWYIKVGRTSRCLKEADKNMHFTFSKVYLKYVPWLVVSFPTRPASTLRVTWMTGSSCSAASTKSPVPLASSATPHSSSPTSSSNDESQSVPTNEQTVPAPIRVCLFKVSSLLLAGHWTALQKAAPPRWPCLWRRCCRRWTTWSSTSNSPTRSWSTRRSSVFCDPSSNGRTCLKRRWVVDIWSVSGKRQWNVTQLQLMHVFGNKTYPGFTQPRRSITWI